MLLNDTVERFLAGRRIAVVGASDERDNFGGTIYKALRDHGYEPVAVHPGLDSVAGDPCYPDLAAVPGALDGAIVMVGGTTAVAVVRECIERGVGQVWLFKGVGSKGAVSDEAIELCHANGIGVVEGACPLMFLEPVGFVHRLHRGLRHLNGSLEHASSG